MLNNYFLIIISTVLVNNIVLTKILGLCPFMGVSKKLETSISMSAATAFVLTSELDIRYFFSFLQIIIVQFSNMSRAHY